MIKHDDCSYVRHIHVMHMCSTEVVEVSADDVNPDTCLAIISSSLRYQPTLGMFLYQLSPSTFVRLLTAKVRLVAGCTTVYL